MSVMHFDEPGLLVGEVASRLIELIEDIQAAGRIPHIVLTGGTIADEIHHEVARIGVTSGVDWGAVEFWFGDERFVPEDSPDRNAGQARSAFLDVLGATRVHEMAPSDAGPTLEEAAAAYGREVRESDTLDFDLVMLGMGPDGHVASMFPGHPALEIDDVAVPVRDSPKPPPERISLSLAALNHAERVWFVMTGEEKAATAERALGGDTALPASRVRGTTETRWFLG